MSMFTNQMRFTDISGLPVTDMVNQIMRGHAVRLDRLRQQRQVMIWQRDMLRDVASDVRGFRDQFLSFTTNQQRNIRSETNFTGRNTLITNAAGDPVRGITIGGEATGTQRLRVEEVARGDKFRTAGNVNQAIRADRAFNVSTFGGTGGFSMRVQLNGRTETISISEQEINALPGTNNTTAFAQLFNERLAAAFGSDTPGNSLGMNPGTYTMQPVQQFDEHGAAILDGLGNPVFAYEPTPNDPNSSIHYQHVWATMETFTFTGPGGTPTTGQRLVVNAREGNVVTLFNGPENYWGHNLENMGFDIRRDNNNNPINPSTAFVQDLSAVSMATFMGNSSGVFNFTINGVDFSFNGSVFTVDGTIVRNVVEPASFTLQHVIDGINNSSAGVRMDFSHTTGQFTMESRYVGATAGRIEFSGPSFFERIGFGATHGDVVITPGVGIPGAPGHVPPTFGPNPARVQSANDAVVYLNDRRFVRASNSFELDGLQISLDLNFLHSVSAATPLNAYITFERDTSHAREVIMDFIEAYNELIRSIRDLTDTRRPRQTGGGLYMPLTDEQRREMSEREIELWEEQARTGLLSRDDTLRRLTDDLHRVIFQDVRLSGGGTINILQLGIRTHSDLERFGELQVDEERLDYFLTNHIDDVSELFTNPATLPDSGPNADRRGRLQESGIGQRLHDVLHWQLTYGGGLNSRVGATASGGSEPEQNDFNRRIQTKDRHIDEMITNLQRRENRYFQMFGRLEAAMMQANSQMMFMEQMFWMA